MRVVTAPPLARLSLATVAAGAAGLAWSLLEAQAFTLRQVRMPVLPAGSSSLRVLHVSDLHVTPSQQRKIDWLRGLGRLEPDLVVSTGDNLAHLDAVPVALAAHGDLLDRPGVFVLGSNDFFAPKPKNPARYLQRNGGTKRIIGNRLPTQQLVDGFTERGWLDLNNRRGTLKLGEHLLEFVGVDDPHIKRDRYSLVAGPADPAASLTMGVAHAPYQRILNAMSGDGCAAILAGHTHGGQLCLPGFGALVTNCDVPRRQAYGVSRWPVAGSDASWLHVSNGIGTSPYTPVRFACRPSATLITLVPTDAIGSA